MPVPASAGSQSLRIYFLDLRENRFLTQSLLRRCSIKFICGYTAASRLQKPRRALHSPKSSQMKPEPQVLPVRIEHYQLLSVFLTT